MKSAFLIGFILEAGYLLFAYVGNWSAYIGLFLTLYAVLFAGMVVAWKKRDASPLMIFGFAILFRLTLFPVIPDLSDDIYRYGWEGRVQRLGFSPYEHAPDSLTLAPIRDAAYERINHKSIPTVYPILSQWTFRLGTHVTDFIRWVGPSQWSSRESWMIWTHVAGQKGLFILFDLLTLFALWRILKVRGLEDHHLLLYAWNPLVIIEIAGSGHLDSLGISLLVLGIWMWSKEKRLWASAFLAASLFSKFGGLLLFPWSRGVQEFIRHWEFNGSVYALIHWIVQENSLWARWISGAIGFLGFGWLLVRRESLPMTLLGLLGAALLVSPVVHPWYVLWIVPFLCFFQTPASLAWNATVVLSYTVLTRFRMAGIWELSPTLQALEYVPVYAGLLWGIRERAKGRSS